MENAGDYLRLLNDNVNVVETDPLEKVEVPKKRMKKAPEGRRVK